MRSDTYGTSIRIDFDLSPKCSKINSMKNFYEIIDAEYPYISFSGIEEFNFTANAFSLRADRRLYMRADEDYDEIALNNKKFLEQLCQDTGETKINADSMVTVFQKHTSNVRVVTEDDVKRSRDKGGDLRRENIPDTDGMVTNIPGAVLVINVADCSAVYIADPVNKAIGLCHAGRKGALGKIAAKAVSLMCDNYGSKPADMAACIAPCICADCYEVGEEIMSETVNAVGTKKAEEIMSRKPDTGRLHFDLKKANKIVLLEAGVREDMIYSTDLCTCCRPDLFYSFRGDGGIISEMGAYFTVCG